jgi:prepilin-type N-terminal cleavage/methylation domain-containing protein
VILQKITSKEKKKIILLELSSMCNKNIHYFNSKAFTLVELMVVIAIASILAAIAIPAYKTYVIKAKFAELITAVDPYKVETVQAFYDTGVPPANRVDVKNTTSVLDIQLWQNNGIEYIHVHPQPFFPEWNSGTHTPLMFVGQVQNGTVVWTCCRHPSAPIPTQYLPDSCQSLCGM